MSASSDEKRFILPPTEANRECDTRAESYRSC
jgi:hypothetical protein